MIKAILFDLDGVLVDAADWHYAALNRALEWVGIQPIPREVHLEKYDGLPTKVKLDMLGISGEQARNVFRYKQDYTIEIISKKCAPTDRIRIIADLSKKYQLGCVTNCITETAIFMLVRSRIFNYFQALVSNEDTTRPKPHPDGYIIAMYKMGIKPTETLIVEDTEKGAKAAEASGARVAMLTRFDKLEELLDEYLDPDGR